MVKVKELDRDETVCAHVLSRLKGMETFLLTPTKYFL